MTNEKLVQSPECEDMCEDMCEEMYCVCPLCGLPLRHDYETGSIELIWFCYQCGYME